MLKLTDEERRHFTSYCRQEAEQFDALAEQMDKLSVPGIAQRERQKAAAFAIVANEIDPEKWETVTVPGKETR